MKTEFRPVLDPKTGEVQLHDMYVDDQWHGSCRTIEQCEQYVDHLLHGEERRAKRLREEQEHKAENADLKKKRVEADVAQADVDAIRSLIRQVLDANPALVMSPNLADWVVGQVMKITREHKPGVVRSLASEMLG